MTTSDFEVHPIGTTTELREVRRLLKELIALDSAYSDSMPYAVRQKIGEITRFYQDHTDRHPL